MNDRPPSSAPAAAALQARAALRQRWQALQPRERRRLGGAGLLIGLALLWSIGLAPALRTLRAAPLERQALERQLSQMQRLAAEARALRGRGEQHPPEADAQAARAALARAAEQMLETRSRLAGTGDQVTVTLDQIPAGLLFDWLVRTRETARLTPIQASLSAAEGELWSGSLSFDLPPGRVQP
jgi:general secretion pathway protein M